MSDIAFSTTLTHKKYATHLVKTAARGSMNQEGTGLSSKFILQAGTSWTELTDTGIDQASVLAIRNLDATNFVEVAVVTDGETKQTFAKLLPRGVPTIVPWHPDANYFYKADTATCNLSVMVFEA